MAGNRKDSPVAGKRDLKRQILARWQLYLLLLLPLIYIAVFAYVPMGGLVIAFKKYNVRQGIWGSAWVGLDNFVKFFTSYKFPIIMKNTLMISLYSLAVSFPIPIIFALLLNAMLGKRYKKAIQTITYVPYFISTVVMVGLIFQVLNNRSGIYGSLYTMFTNRTAPNILADGKLFKHIYVWSGVWQSTGYSAIIYIAALAGVDQSLHEAAEIDGCGKVATLFRVLVPVVKPSIITASIFAFYWIWQDFFQPLIFMSCTNKFTISLALNMYLDPNSYNNYGGLFAMSVISLIPVILFFIIFQRYLVDGIAMDGIKG